MAAVEGVDEYGPEAELELARRAHRGDLAAFEQLVVRFQRPVHRLCWRMLRSSNAEDLAQETFVRAFVHFDRFDPERAAVIVLAALVSAGATLLSRFGQRRGVGEALTSSV